MKILNIYNNVTNTSIPYELEKYMEVNHKSDCFSNVSVGNAQELLFNFIYLYRLINEHDVIHTHHTFSSIVISLYRIFFLNRKKMFICTVHRNYRSAGLKTFLIFTLFVLPFRDIIICNSYSTKASLPRFIHRFFSNKIKVIYNGINLSKTTAFVNTPKHRVNLISVGRLVADKDQITLINMCDYLYKKNIDFHLYICGGGPLENMLTNEITRRGLCDSITLTGNLSRFDVYKKLTEASIYISCSKTEGFGNSTIEAMSSGCLVVVSDIPVHREIIKNRDFLFTTGNYIDLANKIIKLKSSEFMFNNEANACIARSQIYSINKTANAYYSVYREFFYE